MLIKRNKRERTREKIHRLVDTHNINHQQVSATTPIHLQSSPSTHKYNTSIIHLSTYPLVPVGTSREHSKMIKLLLIASVFFRLCDVFGYVHPQISISIHRTHSHFHSSASEGYLVTSCKAFKQTDFFVEGPSLDTKPDYDQIHGPLGPALDRLFLMVFRKKMAKLVGEEKDSKLPNDDYQGLMELTSKMNASYSQEEVQKIAQEVLKSLFPDFILNNFGWMFAKPFPEFSSKMNAWATFYAGIWLMGECEVNDCKVDGGGIGKNQGLLVKRCRFLEESGCASVCVNACKVPTQNFFMQDMGLPLTMEPNYETGECQFSFGLTPTIEDELAAKNTPCLSRCPTTRALKRRHIAEIASKSQTNAIAEDDNKCFMMDIDTSAS